MVKLWTSIGFAGLLALIIGGVVLAQTNDPPQSSLRDTVVLPPRPPVSAPAPTVTPQATPTSTLIYAKVITGSVPVYEHPLDASSGAPPVRTLDLGYVWVSLASTQTVPFAGQEWYRINAEEYVQSDDLSLYQPSTFHGKEITNPSTFAWVIFDTWTAAAPGQKPDDTSKLLKRYSTSEIEETALVEERAWYRVEKDHWVEQGMIGIVTPKPRPVGVLPDDKWIEIDLYEQTLAAYEGDRMVYATLISSGLDWWGTEEGLFRIWGKTSQNKMSGREGYSDYYFLEDVPWTMYFNGDFALHGAYWHDRFGVKHSHGCVNMSLADSLWLFEWTSPAPRRGWKLADEDDPGTWVWVHDGDNEPLLVRQPLPRSLNQIQ
jgi:hypothetical protein